MSGSKKLQGYRSSSEIEGKITRLLWVCFKVIAEILKTSMFIYTDIFQ
jgi:hypothetical protein